MAKLTDRQRKQIIAEYVSGGISQQQLADRYGVTRQAVAKLLKTDESCEKLRDKKEENTLSMLAFMDSRKEKAQSLMDQILNSASDDISKSSLRDKMGAFKILSEAFSAKKEETGEKQISDRLTLMQNAFSNDKGEEDYGDE